MTFTELYNDVVHEMEKIDNEIHYLKGKREGFNYIRLELLDVVKEEKDKAESEDKG